MITRKVDKDDGLAGFTYNWVKKIGEKVETLTVICLESGNISGLPNNVKILPIRGEKISENTLVRKTKDFFNFQKILLANIKNIDGIFCHMNPEYTIVSWPIAQLFSKPIITWHAHGSISLRLKIVEKMANKILTSSKKGFRIKSDKIIITGNGIDTKKFRPTVSKHKDIFTIVSVGRISPTKDLETLIKAIDVLINDLNEKDIHTEIIGSPGLKTHESYYESLKMMTTRMKLDGHIKFIESIANDKIPQKLDEANLFINLSGTGSIDKAVLEAMSSKVIPITSNEAFFDILPKELQTEQNNFKLLAEKILNIRNKPLQEKKKLQKKMREYVKENHNLDNLTTKIVDSFSALL